VSNEAEDDFEHMKMLFSIGAALLALLGFGPTMRAAEVLKPGDVAPDFSLPGSDGKTHKLSDFKGKQAVVVAWFPKAFTGG
jgi:peroxiredoxin Q/BCP